MANSFYLKNEASFPVSDEESLKKLINLPMSITKGSDLDYKISFFIRGDIKKDVNLNLNIDDFLEDTRGFFLFRRRRFFLPLSGVIGVDDLNPNSENFVSLLSLEFDIDDLIGVHQERARRFRDKGVGYNLLEIQITLYYNEKVIIISGLYGENGGTKTGKAVTTNEDEDDNPFNKIPIP